MTDTLDKTYDPKAIETRWYEFWEQNKHFAPSGQGTPYSIMIPPPNVTGFAHGPRISRYHYGCLNPLPPDAW